MLRRAALTVAYVALFIVLADLWQAAGESPGRDAFTNEAVTFVGAFIALPMLLGLVLGVFRRGHRAADYAPFVLGPIGAFALRCVLLGAPFSWVSLPLWALACPASVIGSWLSGKRVAASRAS
jgi:hypothetical protein